MKGWSERMRAKELKERGARETYYSDVLAYLCLTPGLSQHSCFPPVLSPPLPLSVSAHSLTSTS